MVEKPDGQGPVFEGCVDQTVQMLILCMSSKDWICLPLSVLWLHPPHVRDEGLDMVRIRHFHKMNILGIDDCYAIRA